MAEEIESAAEAERIEPSDVRERAGSTLPFILTLTALIIYFGFQTLQLVIERSNLLMVKSNQEGAIQEAQKLQTQFKTLVGKTGELAAQGHAGAKMVMEELLKRGVGPAPEPTLPGKIEPKPAR
jgi:hypothetical protein